MNIGYIKNKHFVPLKESKDPYRIKKHDIFKIDSFFSKRTAPSSSTSAESTPDLTPQSEVPGANPDLTSRSEVPESTPDLTPRSEVVESTPDLTALDLKRSTNVFLEE